MCHACVLKKQLIKIVDCCTQSSMMKLRDFLQKQTFCQNFPDDKVGFFAKIMVALMFKKTTQLINTLTIIQLF